MPRIIFIIFLGLGNPLLWAETLASDPSLQLPREEESVPDRWEILLGEIAEVRCSVHQLRDKIDTLEKQQRDFLALMTDLVVQPQKGLAFQEQRDYEESLDLMKQQQYSQALKLFHKFVQQYPQSEKIPYAYYWIAEIHSAEQNFVEAGSCYQHLYENYPRHAKASEALFKMGKIDYNDGLIADAETKWMKLIAEYPQSQSAQLAKKSLKTLYDQYPPEKPSNN